MDHALMNCADWTDWLAQLDWMVIVLIGTAGIITFSLYRAHCNPENAINLVDLVLENGHMSRLATAFMVSFALSVWLMVDLQLHGKMTEGYLMAFGGIWISPIIAKLVFNKAEPPAPAKP